MTRLAPPSQTEHRSWRQQVTDVIGSVEAESATYNQVTPPGRALRKVAIVLITATLGLTFVSFLRGNPAWLLTLLRGIGLDSVAAVAAEALLGEGNVEFNRLVMFVAVITVGFIVMPVLSITLILREPLREYGVRIQGTIGSWRPYALLAAVSLPFLVLASFNGEFQARYPMYDMAPGESWWPYLWAWWLLYALQFVAVEFFMRGFLVHGLKLRFGFAAVFVMVVPYTMIHFHKPMPEALAAIVGGIVLGYLSLKTRSIWWGVALHMAIAGSMDVLALAQTGLL
jgi:membrane protease YdiL (CAAX protease family)